MLVGHGAAFTVQTVPHRLARGSFEGCATALIDYDSDGRMDVLVACSLDGMGEIRLLRNETRKDER